MQCDTAGYIDCFQMVNGNDRGSGDAIQHRRVRRSRLALCSICPRAQKGASPMASIHAAWTRRVRSGFGL